MQEWYVLGMGKGVPFRVREIARFIVVLMNYSSG